MQTLLSLQTDPFAPAPSWTQPPLGLQVSMVQGDPSSQLMPVPAHAPSVQVSALVQALPSSQPLELLACRQPWKLLHRSVVHAWLSSQLVALGGKPQTPLLQTAGAV